MVDIPRQLSKAAGLARRAAGLALREPGAALTLLRMAGWVAFVSLLLRRISLPRVLGLTAPRERLNAPREAARAARDADAAQARLARLLDALLATDFLCFTPTCWKRAPVLQRFLALEGIETRVVFGVRRDGAGELRGHAWLEAGGQPLLEPSAPEYTVTYSFKGKAEG
jgi:hypothetical protein